jgi:hypothetical protein
VFSTKTHRARREPGTERLPGRGAVVRGREGAIQGGVAWAREEAGWAQAIERASGTIAQGGGSEASQSTAHVLGGIHMMP